MKPTFFIAVFFLILVGCSTDETSHITVKGRVERELNGEGIANQPVSIKINQVHGTGYWSYTSEIDAKEVVTDANGNFSVSMKSAANTFISVYKPQDDLYSAFELTNFFIDDPIILKVNKFLKFKIYVNNTNPFDNNDFVFINFLSGNQQSFRTNITNFGIPNTHYPEEQLPGGGSISAYDEASWVGTNVNSIVDFNVPENADQFKIYWSKRKNGIESTGVTADIPYQPNQVNEYHFEY